MNLTHKILIIEDEEYFREALVKQLSVLANVVAVANKQDALKEIQRNHFDAVIIDIDLSGEIAGFDILESAKSKDFFTIMLTDNSSDDYIKKAYSMGCDHYLTKEQSEQVLEFIIMERLRVTSDSVSAEFFKRKYVTEDHTLVSDIISLKKRLRNNERSLLLLGATGVGKTLLAECIHYLLGGTEESFVALNVASIPEHLIESELFGYKKGAFTGAIKDKRGLLEEANNGTLFLDEITSMPIQVQKKLLKCIEEKIFYPLGGTTAVKVKFRLITSTCEDIYQKIQTGDFRTDFYYRICGVTLTIPSLKERPKDIKLLIKHFLTQGSRQVSFSKEAYRLMSEYCWPGNIRELKSVVEELSQIDSGEVTSEDLPEHIRLNKPMQLTANSAKFINTDHISFIRQYGIIKFLLKLEADAAFEIEKMFKNDAEGGTEFMKVSKAYYYRILQRARNLEKNLNIDLKEIKAGTLKSTHRHRPPVKQSDMDDFSSELMQ
ncbi:MAG: sigma-54-dependent Fis family transcriptional regulator [Oligoflexia bacterium]|nr:sigma-54-dependent Fis family transcriptional regulator [Oligoflexia bacterium]